MRWPLLFAVSLLTAACSAGPQSPGTRGYGEPSSVRHEACKFDDPMLIAGMPVGVRELPIADTADAYLARRCRSIAGLRRALSLIQLRARPVAVWRSASAMDIGVRLELRAVSQAAGADLLSDRAERELQRLARRALPPSDRPIDVLARPPLARAVADHLVAGGVERARIRINAPRAGRHNPKFGAEPEAESDRVILIEWPATMAQPLGQLARDDDAPASRTQRPTDGADAPASAAKELPGDVQATPDPAAGNDGSAGERPPHDFAGTLAGSGDVAFWQMIGWQPEQSIWSFAAEADTPPPHLQRACIDLEDADEAASRRIRHADVDRRRADLYLPGLYETSWTQRSNGHLVGLTRVGVLRRDGRPSVGPTVLVYWNYADLGSAQGAPPDIQVTGAAAATVGEDGVLYRVFLDDAAWPLRCIDLVFTREPPVRVRYGRLYYDNGRVHATPFTPNRIHVAN